MPNKLHLCIHVLLLHRLLLTFINKGENDLDLFQFVCFIDQFDLLVVMMSFCVVPEDFI